MQNPQGPRNWVWQANIHRSHQIQWAEQMESKYCASEENQCIRRTFTLLVAQLNYLTSLWIKITAAHARSYREKSHSDINYSPSKIFCFEPSQLTKGGTCQPGPAVRVFLIKRFRGNMSLWGRLLFPQLHFLELWAHRNVHLILRNSLTMLPVGMKMCPNHKSRSDGSFNRLWQEQTTYSVALYCIYCIILLRSEEGAMWQKLDKWCTLFFVFSFSVFLFIYCWGININFVAYIHILWSSISRL